MILVRDGSLEDIEHVAKMSKYFWETCTVYEEPCCIESVTNMAKLCLDHGLLAILEDEEPVGFAAAVKGPMLGNNSVLVGTEMAWWVNEEYRNGRNGVNLMQHLENMARNQGVKYWNMVAMMSSMPDVVGSIYEKLGYSLVEKTYMRVL